MSTEPDVPREPINHSDFERMRTGQDKMAFRLLRGKWQSLKPMHTIRFVDASDGRTLLTRVLGVYTFPTFADLFEVIPPLPFTGRGRADQLNELGKHYPSGAEQAESMVIGFLLEVVEHS